VKGVRTIFGIQARTVWLALFAISLVACGSFSGFPMQVSKSSVVARCAKDDSLLLRFYYFPLNSDVFLLPIVVQSVPRGDPRFHTSVSVAITAQFLYVTKDEALELLARVEKSPSKWEESSVPLVLEFGLGDELPADILSIEIALSCSSGSAKRYWPAKLMCRELAKLDSAFTNDQQRKLFQLYRKRIACPK